MNACQGIRHWAQSSYEETDVPIAAAPVTTTANQQPPPRGEDFLAMKKKSKCPQVQVFLGASSPLPCAFNGTKPAAAGFLQDSAGVPPAQHDQDPPYHQFLLGISPGWARGCSEKPCLVWGRTVSSPGPSPWLFPQMLYSWKKSQNPLKYGLVRRSEIFRLKGLQ